MRSPYRKPALVPPPVEPAPAPGSPEFLAALADAAQRLDRTIASLNDVLAACDGVRARLSTLRELVTGKAK